MADQEQMAVWQGAAEETDRLRAAMKDAAETLAETHAPPDIENDACWSDQTAYVAWKTLTDALKI